MSAGLLALFLFILLALGFADKNWLNTPDKIWSRSPGSNIGLVSFALHKAADVKMCVLYAPPSETNFGGALLTGSQSACKAACEAFASAVEFVAGTPLAQG